MTHRLNRFDFASRIACVDLRRESLRKWFEMDVVAVEHEWTAPGVLQALYEAGCQAADGEVAALACAAMVDAVFAEGCDFDRLDALCLRIDALLEGTTLSVHARAALLLRQGLIFLVRDAELGRAEALFDEGIRLVEGRVSEPLLLAHRALRGVVDCLAGSLTRADVALTDARFLCQKASVGPRPRLLLEGSLGLVRLFLGQAADACFILGGVCRSPGFGVLAPGMQLLILCHRLYAAADFGLTEEVKDLAQNIGFRAIPARQALLHAYRHFALGAVALRSGDALRALVHAEECARNGERAGARLPVMLVALLQAQALSDLRRIGEARGVLMDWAPRWIRSGLHRFAAVGRLEQAMLDARGGELDRARQSRAAARALLPAGESLHTLHRGRGWMDELDGLLAAVPDRHVAGQAHVCIRSLGEFVVEVGGKRIYDRDWKGVRTKSLLIALICEGGQKVPADYLADMLWPDSEGDQAMQNLKVALHRLRRLGCAPGEAPVNWVHVKLGLVSLLRSLCWVDAHEFASAMAAGLSSDLYRGEFLPGEYSTPGVIAYRARLKEIVLRGPAGRRLQ